MRNPHKGWNPTEIVMWEITVSQGGDLATIVIGNFLLDGRRFAVAMRIVGGCEECVPSID